MREMHRFGLITGLVVLASAVAGRQAGAAVILNLDFGPGPLQSTNNFQDFNPTLSSGAGSASFTPTTSGFSSSTITVAVTGASLDNDRGTNGGLGGAQNSALLGSFASFYRDYIGSTSSTALTLTGLNPSTAYSITFQIYDTLENGNNAGTGSCERQATRTPKIMVLAPCPTA